MRRMLQHTDAFSLSLLAYFALKVKSRWKISAELTERRSPMLCDSRPPDTSVIGDYANAGARYTVISDVSRASRTLKPFLLWRVYERATRGAIADSRHHGEPISVTSIARIPRASNALQPSAKFVPITDDDNDAADGCSYGDFLESSNRKSTRVIHKFPRGLLLFGASWFAIFNLYNLFIYIYVFFTSALALRWFNRRSESIR